MTKQPVGHPGGITRPAMKQAMKMFQPPRVDKHGKIVEMAPPKPREELDGQRDIFDVLLEADEEWLA